jgi:putative endonuclease
MFYTYILFSEKLNRYYIGQSHDVESRLSEHNSGKGIYTGKTQDWVLVFSQQFDTRAEAMHFETKIKNRGAKRFISGLKG